jgi:hypothetical protein
LHYNTHAQRPLPITHNPKRQEKEHPYARPNKRPRGLLVKVPGAALRRVPSSTLTSLPVGTLPCVRGACGALRGNDRFANTPGCLPGSVPGSTPAGASSAVFADRRPAKRHTGCAQALPADTAGDNGEAVFVITAIHDALSIAVANANRLGKEQWGEGGAVLSCALVILQRSKGLL